MDAEHASLDPRLELIEAALEAGDATALDTELKALAKGLSEHMVHEEQEALPLLERRTGKAGWDAFTEEIRSRQGGIRGASEYLPWVLDGASREMRTKVLSLLPAPARLLYRRMWEPKYRRSGRLT
jgi:hypothetical protein